MTSAIPSLHWTLIATPFLDQARSNVLEMFVAGANQPGSLAVADVLRIAFVPDTNRAPTAVPFGAATAENTPLRLRLEDILKNASDPDGDLLTFSADSASTNGGQVTLSTTGVLYTPPTNFTGADAFAYAVNDGHGGIASSTVEILVLAGPVPGTNQVVLVRQASSWALRFDGNPAAVAEFQRSTDLLSWETLWSGAVPIYGILEYADTNAPPISAYYRAATSGP